MKNMKNYIAPDVELVRFSANEACMLTTSGETTNANIIVDFNDLAQALKL